MSAGAIIAVGCWGLIAVGVCYGLSFDVRRWLENRAWERDIQRAERELDARNAAWCAAMARTLGEIRSLDVFQIDDWRVAK